MSLPDPATPGNSDIEQAAWNAVAVASLAYQQEVITLTSVLACAQSHGMTVDDLVFASGLDALFITRLLAEVA
jgi:hypothetical protein